MVIVGGGGLRLVRVVIVSGKGVDSALLKDMYNHRTSSLHALTTLACHPVHAHLKPVRVYVLFITTNPTVMLKSPGDTKAWLAACILLFQALNNCSRIFTAKMLWKEISDTWQHKPKLVPRKIVTLNCVSFKKPSSCNLYQHTLKPIYGSQATGNCKTNRKFIRQTALNPTPSTTIWKFL